MSNIVDPALNNITKQGLVTARAVADTGLLRQNDKRVGRSGGNAVYPHANAGHKFHAIRERAIVFASTSRNPSDGTLKVLQSVNGFGADAARLYSDNDADNIDLKRDAISATTRYAGVANTNNGVDQGSLDQGFSVAFAGLNTLYKARNIPSSSKSEYESEIIAGDLVSMAPPFLENGGGKKSARPGSKVGRYEMVPIVLKPEATSSLVLRTIRTLNKNPGKWRAAMGDDRRVHGIAACATKIAASYTCSTLFGLSAYIAAGVVSPTPAFLNTLSASDRATINGYLDSDVSALNGSQDAVGNRAQAGDIVVANVAEFMGLLSHDRQRVALSAENRNAFDTLRLTIRHTIFYDGKNRAYEFGASKTGRLGVVRETGAVRNDVYGEMVSIQLGSVGRALAGYHQIVADKLGNIIGRATSSTTQKTDKFNIILGVARP